MESRRGYDSIGALWSPGYFRADLAPGHEITLIASTEAWDTILALDPAQARATEAERRTRLLALAGTGDDASLVSELVLAADQFIITPAGRADEAARAKAAGEEVRTVIAGYHWFTDWGRDTMISLDGLTLCTGRHREAAYILRTFGHYVRDGLIPNMFPDGAREGLYHTADATLWFFHAIAKYVEATERYGDAALAAADSRVDRRASPARHALRHRRRSRGRSAASGADGYQLTWMDAKVDDWVVTPRRGKAVEINALWYNALCLLDDWLARVHGASVRLDLAAHASAGQDVVQSALLERDGRTSLRRRRRRAGRRCGLPAESGALDRARPSGAGSRAMGGGARCRRRDLC